MNKLKFPGWPWIAEGIRIGAPIPLTITAAGLVLILWRGGWPIETAEARVQWLGIALVTNLFLLGLALFLSRSGITSFSAEAGPVRLSVNEGKDDDGNQ